MSTVVVSVRVPRRLKEEAEELGIDLRRVVEEALRKAVEEERMRRLAEALQGLREAAEPGLEPRDWVEAVKASRRGRQLA